MAAAEIGAGGDRLLHIGILTHPAYRGRGFGKAVVSAMTTYGLATGAVVQYRTLAGNLASVAIAHALGFQDFGQTLAVRLSALP